MHEVQKTKQVDLYILGLEEKRSVNKKLLKKN